MKEEKFPPSRTAGRAIVQPRVNIVVLDAIGNGGLHAIKEKEATEDDQQDGHGGNEKDKTWRLAAAGDGPAKAVNDAGHGIEAVKPAPTRWYERGRISDGRSEHPELDEEGDDVAHVAIESVKRGKPKADAESSEERQEQEDGKPESGERGKNAVCEAEDGEDYEAKGKVHEAGNNCGDRKNEAGEIHFGDEALIFDDHIRGGRERVGEVGPGDQRGEIEDRIGQAVGRKLGEAAEEQSEDEHVEDGLQDHPHDANSSLFVTDLNVAPDEEVEELAVGPDFAEAELEEAAGRLDAKSGRGAKSSR
jgi:hypothetical protein